MALSVTDPIEQAIDRTKAILFEPFQAYKWFALGFCAFLTQLGSGAGQLNSFSRFGGFKDGGGSLNPIVASARVWVLAHLALVILGVLVLLLVGLTLAWVQARGQFMLLDGVAHNRGEVAAPWKDFAAEGNSLFGFNLVFGVALLVGIALIAALGFVLARPDIRAEEFGRPGITALLVSLPLLLACFFIAAVVSMLLHDFVIPAMYLRRQGALAAWGTVHREVLRGRVSTIVLYFLMKLVIGMAIGILALLGMCLTCCCAAMPYIGTVILLPLFVFGRTYSLCFLEQLGAGWRFFGDTEAAVADVNNENV